MVWQVLIKLNMLLPHNPATPLLGMEPRKIKIYVHKTWIRTSIITSPKWATIQMLTNGRMNKQTVAPVNNRILLSSKKNKLVIYTTIWKNLKNIIPAKRSQTQSEHTVCSMYIKF